MILFFPILDHALFVDMKCLISLIAHDLQALRMIWNIY